MFVTFGKPDIEPLRNNRPILLAPFWNTLLSPILEHPTFPPPILEPHPF
ncbi:MAG: hypothetical protein RIS36_1630 [Pseudomonadota bacterium]|jgi:hypothetical protein